jgi:transcriptional regulator with XRE-family HTH domain
MSKPSTPAGNRLRALREAAGKTQLEVELDAELGSGYLQRVESGKVRHPERETLERILSALEARYTERRNILELFGYSVDAPLPNKEEIAWAVALAQPELDAAVFPAYLLDCAHRLLLWNPIFPKLFQIDDLIRREKTKNYISVLRLLFDPNYGLTPLIANPDIFFPASIRALHTEMQLFHGEAWYDQIIEDMRTCPNFEKYWIQPVSTHHFAARPLTPLEFKLPGIGLLQFRIMAEAFVQDRRFRVIYYLPANPITMQKCLDWADARLGNG